MPLVFVYGTLKRGKANHHYLAGQRYLGEASTEPRYQLHHLGSYPGLVKATPGARVSGEVWEVDEEGLAGLDRLEGLAEGLYTREPMEMEAPWKDRGVLGYLYARSVDGFALIDGSFE